MSFVRRETLALTVLSLTLGCTQKQNGPAWDAIDLDDRIARAEAKNLEQMAPAAGSPEGDSAKSTRTGLLFTLSELPESAECFPFVVQDAGNFDAVEPESPPIERGPLPGFWDTVKRDIKLMPRSMWEDTKKVYSDPGNLIILAGAGAVSLAVRNTGVDGKIDDSHGKNNDTLKNDWSDAIATMGNPGFHFALAGLWYLIGQQEQDTKTYEVGRTMFNALSITGVSTLVLKVAANTDSPNGEGNAWPSGHTSSSFAMAAVLNVSYGPWVGIPSYALAALAGFQRIDDQEHDFSDVIFGMALGIVVGHTVADGHRPQLFGGEITSYVSPDSGTSGIAWVKSF